MMEVQAPLGRQRRRQRDPEAWAKPRGSRIRLAVTKTAGSVFFHPGGYSPIWDAFTGFLQGMQQAASPGFRLLLQHGAFWVYKGRRGGGAPLRLLTIRLLKMSRAYSRSRAMSIRSMARGSSWASGAGTTGGEGGDGEVGRAPSPQGGVGLSRVIPPTPEDGLPLLPSKALSGDQHLTSLSWQRSFRQGLEAPHPPLLCLLFIALQAFFLEEERNQAARALPAVGKPWCPSL